MPARARWSALLPGDAQAQPTCCQQVRSQRCRCFDAGGVAARTATAAATAVMRPRLLPCLGVGGMQCACCRPNNGSTACRAAWTGDKAGSRTVRLRGTSKGLQAVAGPELQAGAALGLLVNMQQEAAVIHCRGQQSAQWV